MRKRSNFLALMLGFGPVALMLILGAGLPALGQTRTWPDTSNRIVVFNDQLATGSMSEAQFQFAALNYAGSQKLTRAAARHLRQYNSNFLVLHYRLGQGLGYRVPNASCVGNGSYLLIIDTDSWVQEWPGDAVVQDAWFYKYNTSRVLNCSYGYYLMDLNNSAWRTWWSGKVLQQLQDNEDDGLFADSYSIPNYLGYADWNPKLPEIDTTFESDWATREHNFTDYIKGQFAGNYKWIPNLGALVTSRDPSDWSNVDGAMVEGFAEWGNGSYFDLSDWELQMNRVLGLVNAGKIVIAQSYPVSTSVPERLFILGCYLLIKGGNTYINMDIGTKPEWFPEYGIDLGAPTDALPTDISGLYNSAKGVYIRNYENGHVYVNPTTTAVSVPLGTSHKKVIPSGGGFVPSNGTAPGTITYQSVTSISVPAHGAVIVLNIGQGCTLSCSATVPTTAEVGQVLSFSSSATAVGCIGSTVFKWDFGDGTSSSGANAKHTYSSAGSFPWTLTVTVEGKTCTKSGTVVVTVPSTAPLITSMTKAGAPFRIIVAGKRLQKGITVSINGSLWSNVSWVSTLKIVINGGAALKAVVPKNTLTTFLFQNPDASTTTVTWSWK
jgi:PKD repeat protein